MASLDIKVQGLDEAIAKFGALASIQPAEVCDRIGALLVTQTQMRITSEKRSPTGEAWRPNIAGTSILFRSGNLAGSIHHQVSGSAVTVGSDLVYAAIHNFGGKITAKKGRALKFPLRGRQDQRMRRSVNMPKRQYLGVSPENGKEIEKLVVEYYEERLK